MATIDRLRRGIAQYESGTGRRMSPQVLQALLQAELNAEAGQQSTNKQLELRERDLESTIQARRDAADAAKMSGMIQLGGTAIQGGMLLKDTDLGKAITSGAKGLASKAGVPGSFFGASSGVGGGPSALVGGSAGSPAASLAAAEALSGAGAAIGGGPAALAAGSAGSPAASLAAAEAGAGAGSAGAASGSFLGSAGGVTAGAGIGRAVGPMLGTNEEIGAAAGGAAMGAMVGGPVGAVIGAGVGLVYDKVADSVGSIICTELYRQGYIPKEVLVLDGAYREREISDEAYAGYLKFAKPVVDLMEKSWLVTQIVRPFGVAWAYEMAHQLDSNVPGRKLGKFLLKVGVPICSYFGKKGVKHGIA